MSLFIYTYFLVIWVTFLKVLIILQISAAESRENARVQLPLKVKGKFFYYMLDIKGEFPNKLLFDATAGLKRKLK